MTNNQSQPAGEKEEMTPLEKQLVELFNATGQMNVLDVVNYVKGLQDLLRFDHCPDILIQHPHILKLNKEVSQESKDWAKAVIESYERLLVEKPIVVQMSEQEYEEYKNRLSPSTTNQSDEEDYCYKAISIKERVPDLVKYVNDKLILLDDYYDILKVVPVGVMTEWEAIKGAAEYWLEKTEIK